MVQLAAGDWLTVEEVAEMLGVSIRRVQAMIKRDNKPLKATLVGNAYLILRDDAEAFAALPREPGRPPKPQTDTKPGSRNPPGRAKRRGGA